MNAKRLRASAAQFVAQHRPAVMIVGAAVGLLVAWKGVTLLTSGGPAPGPVTTTSRSAAAVPNAPAAPNTGAPGATAGGQSASGGTTAGGAGTPGTGRPDPFSPLAGQIGGAPPLPPVPPLSPNSLGASAPGGGEPGAPVGPATQFRLSGIVDAPVPVAILNDATGSYIVEPGDTVVSGVRLVAVDAETHSVTLSWNEQSWQVRLAGGGTTR
jgi:hypothetical protein